MEKISIIIFISFVHIEFYKISKKMFFITVVHQHFDRISTIAL